MAEQNKKGGLDKRQRQIKVSAGREEALYNEDFIYALKRWGPTVLLVIAAASAAYLGVQKWRENRDAKAGVVFGDLDQAMFAAQGSDVSPVVLLRIAEDNAGHGAVPLLARLRAAEQWRVSAMKGYRPGALMDPKTRTATNPDDLLTGDGRKEYLTKAAEQYQIVADKTKGNMAQATFTLTAYMGLAAVAETRGNIDEAKAAYKLAQDLAEKAQFPEYVALAKARIETVEKYATPTTLIQESMVMSWEKPAPTGPSLFTPSGLSGDLQPFSTPGSVGNPLMTDPDPFKIAPPTVPSPLLPDPATPEKKDEPKQP